MKKEIKLSLCLKLFVRQHVDHHRAGKLWMIRSDVSDNKCHVLILKSFLKMYNNNKQCKQLFDFFIDATQNITSPF